MQTTAKTNGYDLARDEISWTPCARILFVRKGMQFKNALNLVLFARNDVVVTVFIQLSLKMKQKKVKNSRDQFDLFFYAFPFDIFHRLSFSRSFFDTICCWSEQNRIKKSRKSWSIALACCYATRFHVRAVILHRLIGVHRINDVVRDQRQTTVDEDQAQKKRKNSFKPRDRAPISQCVNIFLSLFCLWLGSRHIFVSFSCTFLALCKS